MKRPSSIQIAANSQALATLRVAQDRGTDIDVAGGLLDAVMTHLSITSGPGAAAEAFEDRVRTLRATETTPVA
jgi:hypothetical protein